MGRNAFRPPGGTWKAAHHRWHTCLRRRSGRVPSRRPQRACSRPSSNFETRAASSAATLVRLGGVRFRSPVRPSGVGRRLDDVRGGTRSARPFGRGLHDPLLSDDPYRRSVRSASRVEAGGCTTKRRAFLQTTYSTRGSRQSAASRLPASSRRCGGARGRRESGSTIHVQTPSFEGASRS